ncbi:DMT family transporter [Crocosphaera sp.]|uniref:DMT family transporter n=1 Tax=Crocosphaera sp. TaxID=2729996 RepID=UPI003F25BD43|nr:DMT family transporter [Crocosphaera sp.]
MIHLKLASQNNSRVNLISFLTLVIALISISFAPIFIRISEVELGANGTVFNRLFIFFVVFGLAQTIRQRCYPSETISIESPLTTKNWLLLLLVGIVSITSLGLWAISLEYTSVANCMLLNNMTPIFTSIGAWLCFRKHFDTKFILGMILAVSGAIFLGLEDLQGMNGHLIGDLYALLSAVFLGIYFLIVEQLRSRFSATTILLWRCGIGSILLVPFVLLTEGKLFPTTWQTWLAVIGLGLISEGLGQRLLANSLDKFSSSFITMFLLLEPIVSAMLAWFIFAESLNSITGLGFVIILTGIYLAQSSHSAIHEG